MGFPAAPACGILHGVKRVATCCLCALLCLGQPAHAYSSYGDDNPFVEAMLRMMELFGLINRARLPLGVPYAPGYGTSTIPGLGGLSGIGAYSALGGLPGMSPMSPWAGVPGGNWTGGNPMSGLGGWPGGVPGWAKPDRRVWGDAIQSVVADLDGVWDLSGGGVVVIKGRNARLLAGRYGHQDFSIAYNGTTFWWSPHGSNTTTGYRYRMRDGGMILRDNHGKTLLMRRRN